MYIGLGPRSFVAGHAWELSSTVGRRDVQNFPSVVALNVLFRPSAYGAGLAIIPWGGKDEKGD
jgi:hypothetical protein